MMHFLLDGMLGKLSRWLRMIGYEATYLNDYGDKDLLSVAKRDALILLTSDEELYRTAIARGIECFLVEGRTEAERLAALADRYKLNLRIDTTASRCPVCGSPLREIQKKDVEGSVPPATFKVYQTFWVCNSPACGKIYWQGSHWKRIEQTLETARKILEGKRGAGARGPKNPRPESRGRHETRAAGTTSYHKLSGKPRTHRNPSGDF
jgi:uncharacterized protein with PIN domain